MFFFSFLYWAKTLIERRASSRQLKLTENDVRLFWGIYPHSKKPTEVSLETTGGLHQYLTRFCPKATEVSGKTNGGFI